VQILFEAAQGGPWLSKPTDAAGMWSLELEAPGTYVLQAYRGKEAVGPSQTLVLDVRTVTVTTEDGTQLAFAASESGELRFVAVSDRSKALQAALH
jgi:hypothetical protein